MQVKTFEAADIQEALRKVKQEMGPGAVIISTQHVRRGGAPFGIFGKPHVEITAALPEDTHRPQLGEEVKPGFNEIEDSVHLSGANLRPYSDQEANRPTAVGPHEVGVAEPSICPAGEYLIGAVEELRTSVDSLGPRTGTGEAGGVDELRWEMEELRWTVNAVLDRLDPLKGRGIPESLSDLYKHIRGQGVRQDLSYKLLELARQAMNNPEIPKPLNVGRFLEERMVAMMAPPLTDSKTSKRRTIVLVGPTGSGKTTTLAKMAADAALKKRKKVAVISTDTYRIGAVEQLRIYAKIIGVPLLIAGTPKELASAVARNQEADLIFVDTTGRSPRDSEQDAELREQLKGLRGVETHLVLSATAKDRDLWESIRRFWSVPIDSLIFTRLDETKEVGTLFNQAVRSRKPLSYFSTGQRVPEDLEAANPRRLARMVLSNSSESTG